MSPRLKSVRTARLLPILFGVAFAGLLASAAPARADDPAPLHPYPVRVELDEREHDLAALLGLGVDVAGVFDGWARIYATDRERDKLVHLGFRLTPLPDEGRRGLARLAEEGVASGLGPGDVPAQYHDYDTLTQDLQTIAAEHAEIARLSSIGRTVQDRELWMMKLTANPDVEEDEPELLYVAAMHGDEVVGKELCVNLVNYLTDNYGVDPRVTELVDSAEIWILSSMNPDGTESGTRYNAGGVDLNRNFPDWFHDPTNTGDGRQPETRAVMDWAEIHRPVLSANFHGGALVVNYPFDNNESASNVFSPTPDPDQDAFLSVSLTYAVSNPPMFASTVFENGVTNGAEWYTVTGGMQDWNYCWYGDFQVTIEVSDNPWPPASQLPQFWSENRESMLSYFERGLEGLRGVVTDAETGAPVDATVHVDDNPFPVSTDPDVGDYHRVLLPGSYLLHAGALGYETQTRAVAIAAGPATRSDFALTPLDTDLQPLSNRVADGLAGNGYVDPGEEAGLVLTLENRGRGASGVVATLVPTGWFGEVATSTAAYPDIPTGESAECVPPCFRVRLDDDVPPGHKPGFAVRWSAAGGSGISEPFFLDVGPPTCETTAATDVPQSVADLQTTTSTIAIVAGQQIDEVRVPVEITHSYVGDLTVELTSPSGTRVMLHDRSGGSAHDVVGTYGDDLTPAESLGTLAAEPANGTWKLTITDHASGDQGSLDSWSLELCGRPLETSTPAMRLRDLTRVSGDVLLRWWPYPGLHSYRVYRSSDPSTASAFVDVTAEDDDDSDTSFLDTSSDPVSYYLITGVGPQGEGPLGHFDALR